MLSQGLGPVYHHWGGSIRQGDQHTALPARHRQASLLQLTLITSDHSLMKCLHSEETGMQTSRQSERLIIGERAASQVQSCNSNPMSKNDKISPGPRSTILCKNVLRYLSAWRSLVSGPAASAAAALPQSQASPELHAAYPQEPHFEEVLACQLQQACLSISSMWSPSGASYKQRPMDTGV